MLVAYDRRRVLQVRDPAEVVWELDLALLEPDPQPPSNRGDPQTGGGRRAACAKQEQVFAHRSSSIPGSLISLVNMTAPSWR